MKKNILITGANGEIGHELITSLAKWSDFNIVASDIQDLDPILLPYCTKFIKGNILNPEIIEQLKQYQYQTIYHLASILSTKAESNPELAHQVNVGGTLNLLKLADEQSQYRQERVKFIYPSSIAVYGLPNREVKQKAGKVRESEWLYPITMYGCNKLYCEHLGTYFSMHYRQMLVDSSLVRLDFRSIRFPGLISAKTIPSGGTTDYGPEMLHAAAQDKTYTCFVSPDTRLPFMVMPDAVRALLMLENADLENLSLKVYNVTSFNPSAEEIHEIVKSAFPKAAINYDPHPIRQKIVDSWPVDIDDSAATKDWGWCPQYDQKRAFDDYLIPTIRAFYSLGR